MVRNWMRAAALLAALSWAGFAAAAGPIASVTGGEIEGVRQGEVSAFLGVPYAGAPTGANRWRPPRPVAAWTGVRRADRFGASCFQTLMPNGLGPWTHEYVVQGEVSEDCLFLNVWTPAKAGERRPVLVWIHGGAFNQGSGSVGVYDGRALASRGIVVVDINYRLGVFGFLAHPELTAEAGGAPPANWALQDMVAALQWVRANIAAFGGDPDAVTIDGQSAGSVAVHDLIASPLAKGLFRAAIAESGLPTLAPAPSLAAAEQAGLAFQTQHGAASLADLRALSPEQLAGGPPPPVRFAPVVDGVLLPGEPMKLMAQGRFNDVPMIVGQTADEASALNAAAWGKGDAASWRALLSRSYGATAGRFAPLYPAATEAERAASSKALLEDRGLAAIYAWSRVRLAKGQAPVFAYLWDHPEPGPEAARWGAFHSSEIPYVFHSFDASPERGFSTKEEAVSAQISTYWLDFVRTGDPNGAGRPAWPKLTLERPEIMQLGDHLGAEPLLPDAKLEAVKAFLRAGGQGATF